MFKPSEQQQAFFDWVLKGKGSCVLIAVAGAGKTTTIVKAIDLMQGKVAMVAFNRSIADEIKERVSRRLTFINTANGFGNTAVKEAYPQAKLSLKGEKNRAIAEMLAIPDRLQSFVFKLYEFARNEAFGVLISIDNKEAYRQLVEKHSLDQKLDEVDDLTIDEQIDQGIALVWKIFDAELKRDLTRKLGWYDFNDQVWLTVAKGLRVWTYQWLLIDECQDTNPIQSCLYRKMLAPGGRLTAVGDPFQAVYAFRGADHNAVANLKEAFGCIEFPLTLTYRCPKRIVEVAHSVGVTHIQAHESAPDGSYRHISYADLFSLGLNAEDVILCRNIAPLVKLLWALLSKGIPCRIEGRKEIGEVLIKLSTRFGKKVVTLNSLADKLEDYREKQVQKLIAKGDEMGAANVADQIDALFSVINACKPGSQVSDLVQKIESMFADGSKKVTLSTIHKSKGKEWNRVIWYGRNQLQPSPYARKDWQLQQETNLEYVAITRSKNELIEVDMPPKNKSVE